MRIEIEESKKKHCLEKQKEEKMVNTNNIERQDFPKFESLLVQLNYWILDGNDEFITIFHSY